MHYLGVDLGRARIGIALADDILRAARPLAVIERRGDIEVFSTIRKLTGDWDVGRAVVGLPLNMDDSEGPSARLARAFAARLEQELGIPVELFDERLSTFQAESLLRDQGFSGRERKTRIDAAAAAVILQDWLDRKGA
jgi:putative Holliday junction resolvase